MSIQPIKFDIFNDYPLIQAFSTRIGGYSNNLFSSLNLGLSTNDDRENVLKNRSDFFNFLSIDSKLLVEPQQVHSANISNIDKPGKINNCDSLITQKKNLVLTIQTADCFPVFIYDRVNSAIALVHSGWRGTAQNITGKTIQSLKNKFNSKAENLLIALGPGIQQKNYQVDKNTALHFDKNFLMKDGENHFRLNIQGAILRQALEQNIPLKNIQTDDSCTFEKNDLYYSYRRDGKNSGRMMGILSLI